MVKCDYCCESICDGEEYVEFNGEIFHFECVEDMGIKELLSKLQIEINAEES